MSDRGDSPNDRDESAHGHESRSETDAADATETSDAADSTENGATDTMSHDETPSDRTDTEPATETREDPSDRTGDPADEATGAPGDDATGPPADDATGDPGDDATGDPADDATGDPGDASGGTADAGQGGAVDGGETVEGGERGLVTGERRRYFDYAVLAALGILAFVALVQLYLNVSAAIGRWIEPPYRSLFQAAFNLAVLLLAGAGISLQLRRMGSD